MPRSTPPLAIVILAAGHGTRMKSHLVKVLHEIAGRPMLAYPLDLARSLFPDELIVVIGRDGDLVENAFSGEARFVVQSQQLGTGHAISVAEQMLSGFSGDILILYGDSPLLQTDTVQAMRVRKQETQANLVVLTTSRPLPGIIARNAAGEIDRIIEMTDASSEERSMEEYNAGVYLVDGSTLWQSLGSLSKQNNQGELYLTDIVADMIGKDLKVEAVDLHDSDEALGVNTRSELAEACKVQWRRNALRLMDEGVTISDPMTTYIDTGVQVGVDTQIDPGCVITGSSVVGEGVHLKPYCVIESSILGNSVVVGPNAHLRPGSELGDGSRIGNFVEVKNSILGRGVKADHLSYIGDADIGQGTSFGCGTVIVNYDGHQKHRTRIGDRAFIGCNVSIVAPVEIDSDTFVAAGSTVTGNVPQDALAVARARQRNISGWVSRRRKRQE